MPDSAQRPATSIVSCPLQSLEWSTKPRRGSTGPPKWTGASGASPGIDLELGEHLVQPETADRRAEADPDRAFAVMRAHRDHRVFEARIADSRHGEEKLAGEGGRASIADRT